MGVEDTYDSIADAYADRFTDELDRKPFERDLLGALAARLTGTVADIGCGPGQIGRYLFDRGVDVVGVDLSGGMLVEARRHNPGMRFEQADVRSLPFDDSSLGGAVAFYSLIHLPSLDDALTELHRVIRAGGILCVALHEGEGSAHLDQWFDRAVDIDVRYRSIDDATAALIAAGFTIEWALTRQPYDEEQTTRIYVNAIS